MTHSDRTWDLPQRPWAMRMNWHDLLFMHYRVDAAKLQATLPRGLTVDTYDGAGWVGIVPFRMTDVAPRCVPAFPGFSAFPELNVRTYVIVEDKPGVWFYSLDAASRIAVRVARRFLHLNYREAEICRTWRDERCDYRSRRTHQSEPAADLHVRYRPIGDPFCAARGSLEFWLTARYCLYTSDRRGRVLRGEVDHAPWTLYAAQAEVIENSMFDQLGLSAPHESPHLLFSWLTEARAWTFRPVKTITGPRG